MTTLINRVLGRAEVEFQTCMLESLMLYPLALSMPIFNKKSHPTRAVECFKFSIEIKLLQWKVRDIPELGLEEIFVENWHT